MKRKRIALHEMWLDHMKTEVGSIILCTAMSYLLLAAVAYPASDEMDDITDAMCRYENFILLDQPSDREQVIVRCSPEEQVDLYLRRSKETYIRTFEYEKVIAKTGEPLLPAILSVLEKNDEPRDDIDKPLALSVLETMQRKGYYDVAANTELMERIKLAISVVRDEPTKNWLLEMFSQIQEEPRKNCDQTKVPE